MNDTAPALDAPPMWRLYQPLRRRYALCLGGLSLGLLLAFLLAIGIGPKMLTAGEIVDVLWRLVVPGSATVPMDDFIITHIRLPRAALAVLVGGALAASGAAMQGLFRNPLADPGLIGVSSGASLMAALVIVLGGAVFGKSFAALGNYVLPCAAFLGALATTFLVYALARRGGQTFLAMLLLIGVAITAMAMAMIGLLFFLADDQQMRALQFWMLGSLSGANWGALLVSGPLMLLSILLIPRWSHQLNGLLLGEQEAQYLGVKVERLKHRLILVVALAVGAAVSITGGIGFIGLVVPHVVRLMLGPDHRRLIPCSILLGGILMLLADIASRMLRPPAEIPIGIFTALFGAPVFLWLLLKSGEGNVHA